MGQLGQDLKLMAGGIYIYQIAGKYFDGIYFIISQVLCLVDLTEGSLPQQLQGQILIGDDMSRRQYIHCNKKIRFVFQFIIKTWQMQ